jgi:hypothetical protein
VILTFFEKMEIARHKLLLNLNLGTFIKGFVSFFEQVGRI